MISRDPKGTFEFTTEDRARSGILLVTALAVSAQESLGDLHGSRQMFVVTRLLRRQIQALSLLDDLIGDAFREFVRARVRPYCPPGEPEFLERVLSDEDDPAHPYWLAVACPDLLRKYCRTRLDPPPSSSPFAMFRVQDGPNGPEIRPAGGPTD